jgi:hypothetical protein
MLKAILGYPMQMTVESDSKNSNRRKKIYASRQFASAVDG